MIFCGTEMKIEYRIYSKTIRGFLFFFSQKLRITFECGLHSSADFIFFFQTRKKRFPIRPKQTLQFGVIFQLRDTSLVAFNKNCHILAFSLVFCLFLHDATSITVGQVVIQIKNQNSQNLCGLHSSADFIFFSLKNCGLHSSAD